MFEPFLHFTPDKASFELKYGDLFLFIGSCFSDEMYERSVKAGLNAEKDQFGTIFHPAVLARNILACLDENYLEFILERNGIFLSWDASGTNFSYSQEELRNKLKEQRNKMKADLKKAKVIFVTLGTAWGYELIDHENYLVANCHKAPSAIFQKVLSSPYEMVQDWILALEKLKEHNPELQVVFTVSPVRHIKDGLIENNLSKSRLLEAVHQLSTEENCYYFPSYELVIDVLRDYRYFKKDKVHPNTEAIDFIWEKFMETYFNPENQQKINRVTKYNESLNHKILYKESTEAIKYEAYLAREKQAILDEIEDVRIF